MGIFSKLFGAKDNTSAVKDYSFIADIAALITDNNSEVVSALRECASNPWAYAEKNASRYLQRGVVVSDREANDIDDICWIGMIDKLEENGYLFPCDYSEEVENIIWGLSQLKNYSLIESYTDDFEADDDDDAEVIEQSDGRKYFHGMPITAISVGLPIIYVTSPLLGSSFPILLHGIMILAMILFITDFRFPKPTTKELMVIIVIVAVAVVWLMIRYMVRRHIITIPYFISLLL